jgi:hypothetical protein
MSLITRQQKGSKLTIQEMDGNLEYLEQLSSGTEITSADIETLITSNELVPGATYKVTGFNKNMPDGSPENPNGYLPEVLYDDGTDSGVTIYIKALTTDTLSSSGYGEFYNPKYGDGATYDNTDGTGLYGIWDGDNPDPLEVPAYTVDQVVYWGGYAWKNLTGNVGNAEDEITLNSADWEKLPYSNTDHYEKVIDEVKIDWSNKIVIGRTNVENQITVEFATDLFWWQGYYNFDNNLITNPISMMGWGIYSKITPEGEDNEIYGIIGVKVINSLLTLVNFKGVDASTLDLSFSSYAFSNYIGKNTYMYNFSMISYSGFQSNIFKDSLIENTNFSAGSANGNEFIISSFSNNEIIKSFIGSNIIEDGSISNNILENNSAIENNTILGSISNNIIKSSNINSNTINGGSISSNILTRSQGIARNTITSGSISSNILKINANISDNTLTNSSISDNNVLESGASIFFNTLTETSFSQNTLKNDSIIRNCTLISNSSINNNEFINSTFNLQTSLTLTSKIFQKLNIKHTNVNENMFSATDIYLDTEKNIYTRLDGTKRLSYFNTNDTPVIVNVNA